MRSTFSLKNTSKSKSHLRRCIVCRKTSEKSTLFRIVLLKQNLFETTVKDQGLRHQGSHQRMKIVLDESYSFGGRGVYIHKIKPDDALTYDEKLQCAKRVYDELQDLSSSRKSANKKSNLQAIMKGLRLEERIVSHYFDSESSLNCREEPKSMAMKRKVKREKLMVKGKKPKTRTVNGIEPRLNIDYSLFKEDLHEIIKLIFA
jgi:predicted RNA-binding protein YlxR (DUF448 family)